MTEILLFKDGKLVDSSENKLLEHMLDTDPVMFFMRHTKGMNVVMENVGNLNPRLLIKMSIFVPFKRKYYVVPGDMAIGVIECPDTDFYPAHHAGIFDAVVGVGKEDDKYDVFGDRKYEFRGDPEDIYRLLISNGFHLLLFDEFRERYLK